MSIYSEVPVVKMEQPTPGDKKKFQTAMQALQSNRPAEALHLLEEVTRSRSWDPDMWYLQTLALGRMGDIGGVVRCANRALELNPDHFGALTSLANTQLMMGKTDQALETYRKALKSQPDDPSVLNNYGSALSILGRREEAIKIYEQVLEKQPNDAYAHTSLGEAYWAGGHPKNAWYEYKKALELDHRMVLAHLGMGAIYNGLGNQEAVKYHYLKAIEYEPKCVPAYIGLASMLLMYGDIEEAMRYIERAESIENDEDPSLRALRASLHERLGDYDKAYEIVNQIEPLTPQAVKTLTKICHKFGICDEALDYIQQLLQNPAVKEMEKQQLRFNAGRMLDKLGRYEEAFDYYREANESIDQPYHGKKHHQGVTDAIVNRFTVEVMSSLSRATTGSSRPIFIVGMPRSGTSLTEQILSCHADVHGAGELAYIRQAAEKMMTKPVLNGSQSSNSYPAWKIDQNVLEHQARWYLEKIGELNSNARFVIDKMPHNFLKSWHYRTIVSRGTHHPLPPPPIGYLSFNLFSEFPLEP